METPIPTHSPASRPATVAELLRRARRQLADASFSPPPREAGLLLRSVLGWSEAQLLTRDGHTPTAEQAARFEELLERRLRGEPVAYLIGEREFWGRRFAVDSRVLIPRPETEHLIEAVLALDLPSAPRILDLGTGSGCIAVTLALELPDARLIATDRSLDALLVAASNVAAHRAGDRVSLVQADLVEALRLAAFDLVVSNPPYIDPAELATLSTEVVDFEPRAALFAPDGGRATLEHLLRAADRLRPGTPLVLEIGYDQEDLIHRAADGGPFVHARVIRDYAGHPRTAVLIRDPR